MPVGWTWVAAWRPGLGKPCWGIALSPLACYTRAMVTDAEIDSFEAYWPVYLRNHSKKSTQVLHLVGMGAALGAVAAGLTSRRRRWFIALAPALGFGPAWLGHLVFEGNRPTTFDHPLWALRGGLRMAGRWVTGRLKDEIATVIAADEEAEAEPPEARPAETGSAEAESAEPFQRDNQSASETSPQNGEGDGNGAGRTPPPDPHSLN